MRRQAPTMPISPQQLKHFAAATVAITALLALFAGGEQASVAAQIRAKNARNDLAAAGQESLGAKKLETKLAIRRGTQGGFGEEGGGDFGSGGGGGASPARGALPGNKSQNPYALPPAGPSTRTDSKGRKVPLPRPGEEDSEDSDFADGTNQSKGRSARGPDQSKVGSITEASRIRSGGGGSDGD